VLGTRRAMTVGWSRAEPQDALAWTAHYPGTCAICAGHITPGDESPTGRNQTVTHQTCDASDLRATNG